MAPIANIDFSITTTKAMTTTPNNNILVYIASTIVVDSASFSGCFRTRQSEAANFMISTIVPPTISAEPYRKTMIVILFFRCILSLSSSPSISLSNLTAIIAAYFAILIVSVEGEVEHIVDSIYQTFFHVGNLRGIGFLHSSDKSTLVLYLTNRAVDIVFFFSFDQLSQRVMSTIAFLR